jgi:hypothetical protein
MLMRIDKRLVWMFAIAVVFVWTLVIESNILVHSLAHYTGGP